MTMRALTITKYLPVSAERNDLKAFQDQASIAAYARDSMAAAVAQELINGSGGKLNPRANTTRAEAAVFLDRIYTAHQS